MNQTEALKLALEAMTYADACLKKQLTTKDKHEYAQDLLLEAGTAIQEALAQPEHDWKAEYIKQVELHNQTLDELRDALAQQEPVIDKSAAVRIATALGWEPKRKPLTDWEISNVYFDATGQGLRLQDKALAYKFARAIEAAHGIKE